MKNLVFLVPLFLLILIAPAGAYYSINSTGIDSHFYTADYTPGSGHLITQFDLSDIDVPSNTTIVLTQPEASAGYTIRFNTSTEAVYGVGMVRAEGAIEYPNGSVVTFDKSIPDPLISFWGVAKSSITVQYIYADEYVGVGLIFVVYPGPGGTYWHYLPNSAMSRFFDHRGQLITFGQVQVESTDDSFNANTFYASYDEIRELQEGSTADIIDLGSTLWEALLTLVSVIPVIGPALRTSVEWIGIIVSELLWLIEFAFIDNWLGTLILIEFLAISEALIYGRNKTNIKMMRRVADNHIRLFSAVVMIIMFLYENIILRTISALGDLIPG